jgi:hypothetical protein
LVCSGLGRLGAAVARALEQRPNRHRRVWLLAAAGVATAVVAFLAVDYRGWLPVEPLQRFSGIATMQEGEYATTVDLVKAKNPFAVQPLIAKSARLTVVVPRLTEARPKIDEILKRHEGYLGSLSSQSAPDAAAVILATLRVPASSLDAALIDLKALGRVEFESQSGDDVTRTYVDLEARLANARNTERRLTALLQNQAGELADVLSIEKELARVRGEIESMEAERRVLSDRVEFAAIDLTLQEERLAAVPNSAASRLQANAIQGFRTMVATILNATSTILALGPSVLFWTAVLFWPARYLWRKFAAANR